MGLTDRRRVFVEEYLRCWNASEAARRAGYKGRANTIGQRLLTNVVIQQAIAARLADLTMGTDEVLARLTEEGRTNIGDFFTDQGGVEWQMVKARGHLVKRISITHSRFGTNLHFEVLDQQHAQELMGKHRGLFADRSTNLNVDLTKLSDEQIERLVAGEDPIAVLGSRPAGA